MKLKRTSKLLALLLAVLMVVSLLPVGALADDNLPTITYNGTEVAKLKKIGTFEETTMAGYTGDAYLASLPYGAEITSIDCPLSFRDETTDLGHNYFGSGSMCLMYDSDALVTIQDELIYDNQFTDADFIAEHTFGYDGYGDLYSWITFTEALPTENVKGFAVYDADFGTWAGESGTIVFIQIATKEAQQSYSLDAGGVKITYSASKEGSTKQIGTFEETTMAGYMGDVYLASLPYGAEITAIDCPRSYIDDTTDLTHNYFGSGSMCLMYDSDALVTIQDELIYDDQFTDADFIADHTFGYDGYGDLYGWITFTEDLPTEDVKGFAVYDADFGTWAGEGGTVVFIQINTAGESGSTTDKTALAAAIAMVTGDYAENFYQSDDRYNGKPADTITNNSGSFWTDLIASGGPLESAQSVYDNPNATQNRVNSAYKNLSDAIAKLIPASQLNATALYEAVQVEKERGLKETNYTAASWKTYSDKLTDAEDYLSGLFNGKYENIAANQSVATGHITALTEAFEALDALAEPSDLKNAQFAYQQLTTLIRRVFQPTGLNQGAYTEDSWNRFQQAAEQATTFLSTHSEPTGTPGKSETQACIDAYTAFWKAGFETLAAKESGTATISIVDSYALRKGEAPAYKGVYSVDVPAGGITLGDALTASLGAGYTLPWNDAGRGIGVYLNGVYIYQTNISVENRPDSSYNAYSGVRLKGGDEVLVALMQIPTGSNLSGSVTLAPYSDVHSAIRTISFVLDKEIVSEANATAGTPVNLKAQYLCSSLMDYNGLTAPLAGAKVYVSEAFSTKAAVMEAAPDKDSGLVTGSDGVFSLALSSATGSAEGWYAVTVLAQGENSGLSNGANLIVHVTDPDDLSGIKTALKAELEKVYTAYEDDFYSAAQLTQLAALYNNGISGIDAAANSGDAEAAYKTANDGIRAIQKANEIESATNFTAVRLFLTRLPSAEDLQAGKLYNVDKPVLDLLFGAEGYYTRMTEKQRSELSGAESAMLTALRKAYEDSNSGADLPALPAFTVTYEVRNADNGELVDLPLQSNSIGWEFYTFGGFNEDNGSINDRWHYEGDGASAFDDTSRTFTLPTTGAYMTTLNPGVNRGDHSVWDYDMTTSDWYATNIPEHYQMENFDTFWIPRQNVTITYYVHAVDALAGARSTALKTLKTTYQGYKRSDYTAENWATLYQAYQDGVAAINAATTEAEINSARTTATNHMAAVQQKQKNQNGITGWGEGDAFDAGTQVGTVTVIAENTTFPGGTFTGTIFTKTNYPIGENDSMMTVILRALHDEGFTWTGTGGSAADAYDNGYLATISKGGKTMGEFSGENGSGWMGTLNDFMVNEGLNSFTAASGMLGDGDTVSLLFTQNLGVDLGGSWGDSDTTLKTLTVSTGTLIPGFASGEAGESYDFALVIPGNSANVLVTPHASNINYMVKTFLNEKVTENAQGNSFYRRSESIPVRAGDVIYIGCGERAWPSMNKQGAEARAYSGTWYALHVISADNGADYVNELIAKLPAANKINSNNYEAVREQIADIDAVIAALSASEQDKVYTDTLEAVREAAAGYEAVADLKAEIAALPSDMSTAAKADLQAVKAHYEALTKAQQNLLTVAEKAKYDRAVAALNGIILEETATEKLGADVSAIEALDYAATQATANDAAALKTFVEGKLAALTLNGTPAVTIGSVTPAAAGDKDSPNGTNGKYSFTVTLMLDGQSATAAVTDAAITATAYVAPAPTLPTYTEALESVLAYVKGATPEPMVGSTKGEWAVFALNRGGVADAEWNAKYLAALAAYVDENDGKLHDKKYTEYSRVILALTSMGYDATQFRTEKAVYDLVTPLLDKQNNQPAGAYWAEWQGNNGTCFALLAVDSHNYLDNAEGRVLRAALIKSLRDHQQADGGWPISGTVSDLDVTAAAAYALAPYYMSEAKLNALGGTVTYAEVQTMVDNALAYLSGKQNENGGFGSAEADGWVVVALSALDRDADTETAFVKNGVSVLADLLSYYDAESGGFKHLAESGVDQMASEQAAYDLAAYDRFKTGKKALYDMSDVTLRQNEAASGGSSGSGSGSGGQSGGDTEKKIRVTMRLIGAEIATKDVDLGAEAYLPNYVTWIPTTSYELPEGALVYDLWVLATQQAGIRSVGAERDYVETVYAPGGYELSEFTNGNRSGWMYTVNGTHPGRGLTNWTLNDGDVVIWHYINDYSFECADWFNDGQWQALGDGTYYNQWLKAPDTYLGAGGGIGSSGSETTVTEPKAEETTVTVTPEVTDGEAKAEVTAEAVTEALEYTENAQVLTVKVETEDAESVELALDADAVKAAAEAEVDLHIETENGTVKIDAETLKEAAESGKEVSVTVRTNEDGTTAFDATAGGESADVTMKVELPAADEGQVLVMVKEDGAREIVKKSLVEGDAVYAEIPAGATVKVIENSKEFNDVSENAWYAGAVDFAYSHDLFRGVSATGFAPGVYMTRAMLATVLFRLEDEPEGAAGVNFGDVKDGTWYADAVAWASENGIVNGTGSGFAPNANITREQIAAMLYRYVNYLGIDTGARGDVSKFKDGKEVSSWASDAMTWAVEVGLFKGDGAGRLNPKADATRAEVATLMERLIGLLVK